MRGIVRKFIAVGLFVTMSGCAPTVSVPQAPGGYPAIRFTQAICITNLPGNYFEVAAGTVLIGNRMRESDGIRLYCGWMTVRDWFAQEARNMCVVKQDHKIIVVQSPEGIRLLVPRELPSENVEDIAVE